MELRLVDRLGMGFLTGWQTIVALQCAAPIQRLDGKKSGDGGIYEAILDYRMHVECMNNCYTLKSCFIKVVSFQQCHLAGVHISFLVCIVSTASFDF